MLLRKIPILLTVLAFWLAPNAANATLPDDMAVEYYIREDPEDPDSDVIYEIRLELAADGRDGDSVAWKITEMKITEVGTQGTGDRVWVEENPDLSAYDDVWWVEHSDPMAPDEVEFGDPPYFEGTAEAQDKGDPDMEYELEGATCDASCSQLFGGRVAAMWYWLILFQEHVPEATGIEPVEVPEGVDPSG